MSFKMMYSKLGLFESNTQRDRKGEYNVCHREEYKEYSSTA